MIRHTYNTDNFSKEIQEEIVKLWKKDPTSEITVKGPARELFIKWIKEKYPKAIENNEYYTLNGGNENE